MGEVVITANNNHSEVLAIITPQCSQICAGTQSKQNGYDMYQMIILSILTFYDVSWSAEQIQECAQILYDDYYWFTLAELKHFTLSCKSSKFGKSYGKLTPVTFIDWMGQYAEESLKIREEIELNKSGDERYYERWGSHDERKGEEAIDMTVKGQMQHIKSQLKNNNNEG